MEEIQDSFAGAGWHLDGWQLRGLSGYPGCADDELSIVAGKAAGKQANPPVFELIDHEAGPHHEVQEILPSRRKTLLGTYRRENLAQGTSSATTLLPPKSAVIAGFFPQTRANWSMEPVVLLTPLPQAFRAAFPLVGDGILSDAGGARLPRRGGSTQEPLRSPSSQRPVHRPRVYRLKPELILYALHQLAGH